MNNTFNRSRVSHRVAFLTRDIAKLDLSHVRAINRVIASRNNFANDRRANDTKDRVSEAFVNMSR